ncbi:MAG TPA: phosphomethylpyrimidine synthase [Clostridiales bacterium UBA8153]|nr:phosphomethylpyrimidine synthase [Clostridiales bacterium UBA8153]
MSTQLESARLGRYSWQLQAVAEAEQLDPEALRRRVAAGQAVILANPAHKTLVPCGIGQGLRVKVNANLGTSGVLTDLALELAKLEVAVAAGADTVMDLSTGAAAPMELARREILARSRVPVGTVPVYQAAVEAMEQRGSVVEMTADALFSVIERQAADGVDFITVHCGVNRAALDVLQSTGRVASVVSRGGAFTLAWMLHHHRENPLYAEFDRLLDIARRHDVTLSLGDGMRPGSVVDASDAAQVTELVTLGQLVPRARAAGVQVMVEGPGHVPLHQVRANVELAKSLCHGAPFYVLGPLVTDIAPGYDHITAAIGGAIAAWAGADFLCYVTPAEHLGLPTAEHVREGVMAARIAAHAAGLARGDAAAWAADLTMSSARKALDWPGQLKVALDAERASSLRRALNPDGTRACSMCGELCAMDMVAKALGTGTPRC